LRAAGGELRQLARLRALPPRVAWFQVRARRAARASGDEWTLLSATRPDDLTRLLALARGRREVVELGTGTAWTAISLALADPGRRVTTFDPIVRPERRAYLELAGPRARARIELHDEPGDRGPGDLRGVELLFVDSSHERDQTIREVEAWRPALAPRAIVVFDDYDHPDFPGVREAIDKLGLPGEPTGTLFVYRVAG
jgi:predicted O-methyltransferase YrrM